MRPLVLDHLTVAGTRPAELVEIAARSGYAGVGMFVQSLAVLPAMPAFDLVADAAERRSTAAALTANAIALELAYPVTLTKRTEPRAHDLLLDAMAELGARRANVLCYDRDPARRADSLAALAERAALHGIRLCLEFYSLSPCRSLADALALADATGRADVGITVDLLHFVRSGEMPQALEHVSHPRVQVAQLCGGWVAPEPVDLGYEASTARLLPGQGDFGVGAFASALSTSCIISVEAPTVRVGETLALAVDALLATRKSLTLPIARHRS